MRRAVAKEAACLLPVEAHQTAKVFIFFDAMEDLIADPDKYAKTSIAQVAKADKELRIEERASTNRSIVRTLTGIYPLEAIWKVTL
jgi:hypothetical protein